MDVSRLLLVAEDIQHYLAATNVIDQLSGVVRLTQENRSVNVAMPEGPSPFEQYPPSLVRILWVLTEVGDPVEWAVIGSQKALAQPYTSPASKSSLIDDYLDRLREIKQLVDRFVSAAQIAGIVRHDVPEGFLEIGFLLADDQPSLKDFAETVEEIDRLFDFIARSEGGASSVKVEKIASTFPEIFIAVAITAPFWLPRFGKFLVDVTQARLNWHNGTIAAKAAKAVSPEFSEAAQGEADRQLVKRLEKAIERLSQQYTEPESRTFAEKGGRLLLKMMEDGIVIEMRASNELPEKDLELLIEELNQLAVMAADVRNVLEAPSRQITEGNESEES